MPVQGIKLHPRRLIVQKAENALNSAIVDWAKGPGNELTEAEYLKVLADTLASYMSFRLRMLIRMERHGTTEKKGDES